MQRENSETLGTAVAAEQSRFQPLPTIVSPLSARSVPVLRRSEVHAHYYAAETKPGPSPEPRVNERPGRGSGDYKTSPRMLRTPEINLRIVAGFETR